MDVTDLSAAEAELWEAFPQAGSVDLRPDGGVPDDPADGAGWGPERSVRADLISALLLGARAVEPGRVPAVRLSGARITGQLDLSFAEVNYAASLRGCFWDEEPRLAGAQLRRVSLSGSCLPGLEMPDAQVNGLLLLDRCRFRDRVDLTGTHVSGILSLTGAELRGDPALKAVSLTVERELVCVGMTAHGECVLAGAHIGGRLVLDRAHLSHPGGQALTADGVIVQRGVFCQEGFTADGGVRFPDAQIGRGVTMSGASLRNPGKVALAAERVTVDGELALNRGFTADGQVLLRGATIRGGLSLNGATLRNPSGIALNAGRTVIDSGLYAMENFAAHGEVQIGGARIQGSANFTGARLLNPGGVALLGDRLEMTGRFFCGSDFMAQGEIRLVDARIGSGLHLTAARLSNSSGRTLNAEGLTVGGGVSCDGQFTADGPVSMVHARINRELSFEAAAIRAGLDLRFVRATALRTDARTTITGILDLQHASVEVLHDDPGGWPATVRLDGFTYTTAASPLPAAARLPWIARDSGSYQPQPYEQLAAVYRRMGHDSDARTVLLAKQRRRRRTLSAPSQIWGYLQDCIVGYGYRPQRAALWLAVLLAIGTAAFAADHPAPLDQTQAPEFNPFLYALDLLLPIAGFGQRTAFNPLGWHHWLAASLIAAGWILATTIAAGVTRVLSRQ